MAKVVRYVWVGPLLQPLGLFNVLSWLEVGWGVVIHHFPPEDPKEPEPVGSKAQLAKQKLAPLVPEELLELFIPYAVKGQLDVVHVWCRELAGRVQGYKGGEFWGPLTELFNDLRRRKVSNWYYAVADMAKTLTAGSCEGIVLDLKIGPSPHADTTFEQVAGPGEKMYGMKRAGGSTGWENQCMGCLKNNDAQGRYFEAALELIGTRYCGKKVASGDEIFQGMTSFHGKMMEKLGASAINLAGDKFSDFGEFLAIGKVLGDQLLQSKDPIDLGNEARRGRWEVNHGPFRVFQFPGHYNWFPKMDVELHRLCVALTMTAVANSGLDKRFRPDSELCDLLRRLAVEVWTPKKVEAKPLPAVEIAREIVDDMVERALLLSQQKGTGKQPAKVPAEQPARKLQEAPKQQLEQPKQQEPKVVVVPRREPVLPMHQQAQKFTCPKCRAEFEDELGYAFHKMKCK